MLNEIDVFLIELSSLLDNSQLEEEIKSIRNGLWTMQNKTLKQALTDFDTMDLKHPANVTSIPSFQLINQLDNASHLMYNLFGQEGEASLTMYDLNGQLLNTTTHWISGKQSIKLNKMDLTKGLYILHLHFASKKGCFEQSFKLPVVNQ